MSGTEAATKARIVRGTHVGLLDSDWREHSLVKWEGLKWELSRRNGQGTKMGGEERDRGIFQESEFVSLPISGTY